MIVYYTKRLMWEMQKYSNFKPTDICFHQTSVATGFARTHNVVHICSTGQEKHFGSGTWLGGMGRRVPLPPLCEIYVISWYHL